MTPVASSPARFQFIRFQKEDLARFALTPGGVLGWDTGLGKTIAMYAWPLLVLGPSPRPSPQRLCPARATLLVAPGDLHDQIRADGRDLFKTIPTSLESQETFLRLSTLDPQRGTRELPPGYYLTTYTQLTRNGVATFPELDLIEPEQTLAALNGTRADLEEYFAARGSLFQEEYALLQSHPDDSLSQLTERFQRLKRQCNSEAVRGQLDAAFGILRNFHVAPSPGRPATRSQRMEEGLGVRIFDQLSQEQVRYLTCRVARHLHAEYSRNLGECRAVNGVKIRCVYSPALVDLCQDTFAAVAADEATKLKGEDTIIGTGTRQLNPQFRLVLSATPIKNRLPDVFRLAHWGTGGHADAHPRFPYPDSAEAREEFAEEFMISERNLSREEDTGRRYQKLTPQVCNVHRLWKFFASCILRRRKKDCGEDIVAKHRHVIRMPMGRMQAEVYRYHLAAKYRDRNGRPAIGAQLMALRIAAADPTSALLKRPEHDGTAGTVRSSCSMVPKLFSTLGLLQDILLRGEQAIVFHTFHDSIDIMSARLTEAGVKHFVLDGRVSPAKRGRMAAEFKKQTVPLLLANSECMAEGHSFPRCNNVIHYSYPWALDKVLQSDDRVHRINSTREVNSYRAICTGSIDLRMEAQAEEKSDAADLVLDGQLLQKYVEELNMAELLQNAWQEFSAEHTDLIDERELVKAWPALRQQLAEVARHWVAGVTATAGPSYPSPKIIIPTAPAPVNIIPLPRQLEAIPVEFRDLPLFAM